MSDKIDGMISGVRNFIDCLDDMICEHFSRNADSIVDMNRDCMSRGLRPDGSVIDPYITALTDWEKARRPYDNPERPIQVADLFHTGAFYGSLRLVAKDGVIEIVSEDDKWDHDVGGWPNMTPLHAIYGEVLGIPEWDMEDIIMPALKEELSNKLREALTI